MKTQSPEAIRAAEKIEGDFAIGKYFDTKLNNKTVQWRGEWSKNVIERIAKIIDEAKNGQTKA